MSIEDLFSSSRQLDDIRLLLEQCLRLPFIDDSISGEIFEYIVSQAKKSKKLKTYDFVDVINKTDRIGWQLKSTKESSPITWKRVKIEDQKYLIEDSFTSPSNCKHLGDTVINHCNQNIKDSMVKYGLEHIGFCHLTQEKSGRISYYEKHLTSSGILFNPDNYTWRWSDKKNTQKKEQLPALHGFHNDKRIFSWHGQGENQLHFLGEDEWIPELNSPHQFHMHTPMKMKLSEFQNIDLISEFEKCFQF